MKREKLLKIVRNRNFEVVLIILFILTLCFGIFIGKWFWVVYWVVFVITDLTLALNKYEDEIVEFNDIKVIILSNQSSITSFLICTLLLLIIGLVYFKSSIEIIECVLLVGLVITLILPRIISKHYMRKLYIPYVANY